MGVDQPDVYQYDDIPRPFRVQVHHIWQGAIGPEGTHWRGATKLQNYGNRAWEFIQRTLAEELGQFQLAHTGGTNEQLCLSFLLNADTSGVLDIIELSFRLINTDARKNFLYLTRKADDAIADLNRRFRENGLGYQFEGNQLIRTDSEYVHQEVVKPALSLLQSANFKGALEEFLGAHDHHRHGRTKEAIAEALKAFESTMKTICDLRKWPYPVKATAKPLLDLLCQNGLFPPQLESHFTALRSALESGVPTIGNTSTARHGQGKQSIVLPDHLAAFTLHLTASAIVFLIKSHQAKAS